MRNEATMEAEMNFAQSEINKLKSEREENERKELSKFKIISPSQTRQEGSSTSSFSSSRRQRRFGL